MASNLIAMASNLIAMASNLEAMASNLIAMDDKRAKRILDPCFGRKPLSALKTLRHRIAAYSHRIAESLVNLQSGFATNPPTSCHLLLGDRSQLVSSNCCQASKVKVEG